MVYILIFFFHIGCYMLSIKYILFSQTHPRFGWIFQLLPFLSNTRTSWQFSFFLLLFTIMFLCLQGPLGMTCWLFHSNETGKKAFFVTNVSRCGQVPAKMRLIHNIHFQMYEICLVISYFPFFIFVSAQYYEEFFFFERVC